MSGLLNQTFLLVYSSVRRKQELCFVHGERPLYTVNAKKAKAYNKLLGFKSIPSMNCENTIQYFLH